MPRRPAPTPTLTRARLAWSLSLVIAATGLLFIGALSTALASSYRRQPPVLSVVPSAVYITTFEPDPAGDPAGIALLDPGADPESLRIIGSRLLSAGDFDHRWSVMAMQRLVSYATGAAAAVLLLAVAAGRTVARRVSYPLESLADTAAGLSAADLSRRIDVPLDADQEIRQLAGALNGMLDRLQGSFDDLESLNAYVSHELRTGLATMRTQLEVGLAGATDLRRAAESALLAAGRTAEMVEDVLSLAAQAIPEETQPVDMALVAAQAIDEFAAPGRQLTLTIPPDGVPPVSGHETWLYRAVVNLLDNALKHGPANGPVEVKVAHRYGAVVVSVRDYGPGIAVQHQELIWQRFWRAPAAAAADVSHGQTGHGRGYGLGLALVRQAAEAAGGAVWLESEPGQGATFYLSLPVAHL